MTDLENTDLVEDGAIFEEEIVETADTDIDDSDDLESIVEEETSEVEEASEVETDLDEEIETDEIDIDQYLSDLEEHGIKNAREIYAKAQQFVA